MWRGQSSLEALLWGARTLTMAPVPFPSRHQMWGVWLEFPFHWISFLLSLELSGHKKALSMTLVTEKFHLEVSPETKENSFGFIKNRLGHPWAGGSHSGGAGPAWWTLIHSGRGLACLLALAPLVRLRAEGKGTQKPLELGLSLDVPSCLSVVAARSEKGP